MQRSCCSKGNFNLHNSLRSLVLPAQQKPCKLRFQQQVNLYVIFIHRKDLKRLPRQIAIVKLND